MQIQSKLPNVGTTIFTTMSALSLQHNAVNLGQGFPDYAMDQQLIECVHQAMSKGFNQYIHMNGYVPLREKLAQKVFELYQNSIHPEHEITITPGGTYAIYTALTTVLNTGDEVIVLEPAYDSYIPNIEINGAKPVLIPLTYPEFKIDWSKVAAAVTSKTKMIMLNSPHNPTGTVLNENDLAALKKIVSGTNIFILSDEVYEHLIFDDLPHLSMLHDKELYEHSFVCFSFGKTYHCTGWKLGYCIAPPALSKAFRTVHQFNAFTCNTPAQVGLAQYLENREAYKDLPSFMQQKRDYFLDLMNQTKFKMHPTSGSYFVCGSYGHMSEETDKDFAIRLIKDFGVATIPLSSFYKSGKDDKVLRFCFSKKKETLNAAAERLMKL